MKKSKNLILLFTLMSFIFAACSDEEETSTPGTIDSININYTDNGGDFSTKVLFSYDAQNRLIKVDNQDMSEVVTFTYENNKVTCLIDELDESDNSHKFDTIVYTLKNNMVQEYLLNNKYKIVYQYNSQDQLTLGSDAITWTNDCISGISNKICTATDIQNNANIDLSMLFLYNEYGMGSGLCYAYMAGFSGARNKYMIKGSSDDKVTFETSEGYVSKIKVETSDYNEEYIINYRK